jgi:hypothetical protein
MERVLAIFLLLLFGSTLLYVLIMKVIVPLKKP